MASRPYSLGKSSNSGMILDLFIVLKCIAHSDRNVL